MEDELLFVMMDLNLNLQSPEFQMVLAIKLSSCPFWS